MSLTLNKEINYGKNLILIVTVPFLYLKYNAQYKIWGHNSYFYKKQKKLKNTHLIQHKN